MCAAAKVSGSRRKTAERARSVAQKATVEEERRDDARRAGGRLSVQAVARWRAPAVQVGVKVTCGAPDEPLNYALDSVSKAD